MKEKKLVIAILILTIIIVSCSNRKGDVAHPDARYESTAVTLFSADNGDGTFTNPVIYADYSDPDVIRTGDDFYMIASSFNCVPGIPILHSRDLVNWEITGYALKRLVPAEHYSTVRHGGGSWAPCIRYHNNEYFIYFPDPDNGIYMIKAGKPEGPWSEPVLVKEGTGFIDPSPLWDDDGKAYLVYAFAGSRAGVKSVLIVSRMNPEGTHVDDEGVMIFDGHDDNPTIEGPKFYKRNGYYYVFAPAGGVPMGWQLVLRSKNIFGPYEAKTVLHQGAADVNGPHQGAWITTPSGEDWFIHFQDKGAYGRIVHLEPMKWLEDWPQIGVDIDNDGIGEPVTSYKKPHVKITPASHVEALNDEFNGSAPGLLWQWHANTSVKWGYSSGNMGFYRLNCIPKPHDYRNLWDASNLMLQKLPAEEFTATASVRFNLRFDGEEAGMVIMGRDYQYLSLKREEGKTFLRLVKCTGASEGGKEEILQNIELPGKSLILRAKVEKGALCTFSYSLDGSQFNSLEGSFRASAGMWIGAKIGFFALREGFINDGGGIDIDWFRISKND